MVDILVVAIVLVNWFIGMRKLVFGAFVLEIILSRSNGKIGTGFSNIDAAVVVIGVYVVATNADLAVE